MKSIRSLVVVFVLGSLLCLTLASNVSVAEGPKVEYARVDIRIDNSYAVTRVTEVLRNPSSSAADITFSFQLPEQAFISNFSVCLGNRTYYGKVLPAQQAQDNYDNDVAAGKNSGLLAARGKTLFSYSLNLKAGQEATASLTFEELLRMKGGQYEYCLDMSGNIFGMSVPSMEISSVISYSNEITNFRVLNYTAGTNISSSGPGMYRTTYSSDMFIPAGNYIIKYGVARTVSVGRVVPCYDGVDTYFIHQFSPDDSELGGSAMPKQIVFILDRSGSMSGAKISQLKDAFEEIVGQLGPEDTFNIVVFSYSATLYCQTMVSATPEKRAAAISFIQNVTAQGSTALHAGLTTGMSMMSLDERSAPIAVLLTDGQPNIGMSNTADIRKDILSKNTNRIPIYCLGFGADVDFGFLDAMALENGGRGIKIYTGSDAGDQIMDFYSTISRPLMTNLKFIYSPDARVYNVGGTYLYDGSEIVLAGKISGNAQSLDIAVSGNMRSGNGALTTSYDLTNLPPAEMASRFWNYARIKSILDQITVEGPKSRLIPEVTNLSVSNSFVTEYTCLYVKIDEAGASEPVMDDSGTAAPSLDPAKSTGTMSGPGNSAAPSSGSSSGASSSPSSTGSTTTSSGTGQSGTGTPVPPSAYNPPSQPPTTNNQKTAERKPAPTGGKSVPYGSELIPLAIVFALGLMAVRGRGKTE